MRWFFELCRNIRRLFTFKKLIVGNYDWICDFSKPGWEKYWKIKNNVFYNNNSTLFMADSIFQNDSELNVECRNESGIAETWQRKDIYNFIGGNMQSWDHDFWGKTFVGGTIEVEMVVPGGWAAFWLLKVRREKKFKDRFHSVPEIDLGENNGDKVDFCVHWGYDIEKYNKFSLVHTVHRPDGKFHKYAVKHLPDGYEFYFDGKLEKKYKAKDAEMVDIEAPYYMIITSAGDLNRFDFDESVLRIRTIKHWK